MSRRSKNVRTCADQPASHPSIQPVSHLLVDENRDRKLTNSPFLFRLTLLICWLKFTYKEQTNSWVLLEKNRRINLRMPRRLDETWPSSWTWMAPVRDYKSWRRQRFHLVQSTFLTPTSPINHTKVVKLTSTYSRMSLSRAEQNYKWPTSQSSLDWLQSIRPSVHPSASVSQRPLLVSMKPKKCDASTRTRGSDCSDCSDWTGQERRGCNWVKGRISLN